MSRSALRLLAVFSLVISSLGSVERLPAQARWRRVPSIAAQKWGAAMAYDPVRERVVLFGGQDRDRRELDDTWEWDGKRWELRRPRTRPPARTQAMMAHDPVGGRVLLFGGIRYLTTSPGFRLFGDTWAWDGRDWVRLNPTPSPTGRYAAAMATDPLRRRIVLFSGLQGTGLFGGLAKDLWEWDGRNWTQRRPPKLPEFRFGRTMAYHPRTKRIIVSGGGNGWFPFPYDVWEWDGLSWRKKLVTDGPAMRVLHSMATDPVSGNVLVFGGKPWLNKWLRDGWEWDGTRWKRLVTKHVPAMYSPLMVEDRARGRVLLFGSTDPLYDVEAASWTWAEGGWTRTRTDAGPRRMASIVHDRARDQLLAVSSWEADPRNKGPVATWVLEEDGSYRRLMPAQSPPARDLPGLVNVGDSGKVLMFGGFDVLVSQFNDTWLWDGRTWTEDRRSPKPPLAWGTQSLAYDSHRKKVVYVYAYQTWEWDAGTGWRRRTPAVHPRVSGPIAYDPVLRRTVLFGTESRTKRLVTWHWDGTAWAQAATTVSPPKLGRPVLAYVPGLGGCLLFGGRTPRGDTCPDTWLWDGKTWSKLSVNALPATKNRLVLSGTYDSARQRVIALYDSAVAWEFLIENLRPNRFHPRPGETLSLGTRMPGQSSLPFLLLLSQGTHPGIPLRPVPGLGLEVLPLRPDPLFWLSFQLGLATQLDAKGVGTVRIPIPRSNAFRWFRFHAAGLTLKPGGGIGRISNRVPIQVVR